MNGGANQDKSLIELLGKNSVPREILSQPELIDELDELKVMNVSTDKSLCL